MRIIAASIALFTFLSPAHASGKIYWGSRAGMTVTVISIKGLNTSRAVIHTKHMRADALAFCRDYVQKVSESCITENLSTPLNDTVSANCDIGKFVDFYGAAYRFEGRIRVKTDLMAHYAIRDLKTGELADGSSASGYSTNMGIFRALCPARAPTMQEE